MIKPFHDVEPYEVFTAEWNCPNIRWYRTEYHVPEKGIMCLSIDGNYCSWHTRTLGYPVEAIGKLCFMEKK